MEISVVDPFKKIRATKCSICRQSDHYEPDTEYCGRCGNLNLSHVPEIVALQKELQHEQDILRKPIHTLNEQEVLCYADVLFSCYATRYDLPADRLHALSRGSLEILHLRIMYEEQQKLQKVTRAHTRDVTLSGIVYVFLNMLAFYIIASTFEIYCILLGCFLALIATASFLDALSQSPKTSTYREVFKRLQLLHGSGARPYDTLIVNARHASQKPSM
jgi:hypothetical protein